MPYRCHACGQDHDDLPDIGADFPDQWLQASDAEKAAGRCTSERCVVDGDYFIRGVIDIPIHDYHHPFGFGVWVSQKKENFETYEAHPDTSAIGPFFGWLNTHIAFYPVSTRNLPTMAHFTDDNQRPRIELHPDEAHPLAVAQRDGITLAQAWDIVHFYMPADEQPRPAARKGKP